MDLATFGPWRMKEDRVGTSGENNSVTASRPMGTYIQMRSMLNQSTFKIYKPWECGADQNRDCDLTTRPDLMRKGAFPMLTAVIEVNKGVVQKVSWDDDGENCPLYPCSKLLPGEEGAYKGGPYNWMGPKDNECKFNSYINFVNTTQSLGSSEQLRSLGGYNCLKTHDTCTKPAVTDAETGKTTGCYDSGTGNSCCDLKVYIAWVGSDKNGRYFSSSSSRFSRFRMFNLGALVDSAKELGMSIGKSFENVANTAVQEANTAPTNVNAGGAGRR